MRYEDHPYFGPLPINEATCPTCGAEAGTPCLTFAPCSPVSQSAEEEREDAVRMEAEISAVGFMAWDSEQHRRHGLPCPYDGYDPAEVYVGLGEIDGGGE